MTPPLRLLCALLALVCALGATWCAVVVVRSGRQRPYVEWG